MNRGNAAKLTLKDIEEIRGLYTTSTITMQHLSERYRVTPTTIWRHLKDIGHKNKSRGVGSVEEDCNFTKLNRKQARQILLFRLRDGMTQSKIAMRFNVDQSTISNICTGKTWKHLFQGIKKRYNVEQLNIEMKKRIK